MIEKKLIQMHFPLNLIFDHEAVFVSFSFGINKGRFLIVHVLIAQPYFNLRTKTIMGM